MYQAFIVMLREGIESFLIVSISISYLRRAGKTSLIPAIHWGVATAVLVSIGAGIAFSRAANQALWEGVLALAAAVLVSTLTIQMAMHAKTIKKTIETKLQQSAEKAPLSAIAGVFLFTVLMITREGMEAALVLNTILFQVKSMTMAAGAVLGLGVASVIALLWAKYGYRINLSRFLQVTAVFLLLFVVQLLIYGFHELTEANIFGFPQSWHDATEPYGPEGRFGLWLSYGLVLMPLAWLAVSWAKERYRTVMASS